MSEYVSTQKPLGFWKGILYNVLYKLNIIKHFNYEDIIKNACPMKLQSAVVESYRFAASLKFTLFRETLIHREWWYFRNKNKPLHVLYDSRKDFSVLSVCIDGLTILYHGHSFTFYPEQNTVTIYKYVAMGDVKKAERTLDIRPFFMCHCEYVNSLSPEELRDGDIAEMMSILKGRVRDYLFEQEKTEEFKNVFDDDK